MIKNIQNTQNEFMYEDEAIFFEKLVHCVQMNEKYVDYLLMEKFFTICLKSSDANEKINNFVNILQDANIENTRIALLLQSISMNYGILYQLSEEVKNIETMKELYYKIYNKSDNIN